MQGGFVIRATVSMCKGGERGDVLWRRGGSSTEYSEPLDVLPVAVVIMNACVSQLFLNVTLCGSAGRVDDAVIKRMYHVCFCMQSIYVRCVCVLI